MRRHVEAASARQGAADRGEYREVALQGSSVTLVTDNIAAKAVSLLMPGSLTHEGTDVIAQPVRNHYTQSRCQTRRLWLYSCSDLRGVSSSGCQRNFRTSARRK
jgi:hypothetical protein